MSNQAITLALQTQDISPAEKLLLIVLSNYANQELQCWPSHARLAKDTCMSRRTIIRTMALLSKKQLIGVRARKRSGLQTTSVYTLTFRGDMLAQRGDIDALDAVPNLHEPSDTVAHETKRTLIEPPRAREASACSEQASRAQERFDGKAAMAELIAQMTSRRAN